MFVKQKNTKSKYYKSRGVRSLFDYYRTTKPNLATIIKQHWLLIVYLEPVTYGVAVGIDQNLLYRP